MEFASDTDLDTVHEDPCRTARMQHRVIALLHVNGDSEAISDQPRMLNRSGPGLRHSRTPPACGRVISGEHDRHMAGLLRKLRVDGIPLGTCRAIVDGHATDWFPESTLEDGSDLE